VPFGPFVSEAVGEMRLQFADLEHGTLTYLVNGARVVKSIERQLFSPEMTACFG
jgi:hypothetical protein